MLWHLRKKKKEKSSEGISLFTLKETSNCLCKQHLGNEERESLGQKGMNKTDTFLHLFEKTIRKISFLHTCPSK